MTDSTNNTLDALVSRVAFLESQYEHVWTQPGQPFGIKTTIVDGERRTTAVMTNVQVNEVTANSITSVDNTKFAAVDAARAERAAVRMTADQMLASRIDELTARIDDVTHQLTTDLTIISDNVDSMPILILNRDGHVTGVSLRGITREFQVRNDHIVAAGKLGGA